MLVLLGQLLFDVPLETTEEEGSENAVETEDELLVDTGGAVDHVVHGVAEPLFEFRVGLEDVGHQKVHERPDFHEVVLEGRSSEQETALRVVIEEDLPTLTLKVLDVLGLIEDHVLPLFPAQDVDILGGKVVRGDADMERVLFAPSKTLLFPLLLTTIVAEDLEGRSPALELALPVEDDTGGHNNEMRTPDLVLTSEVGKKGDGHDGLAETHLVSQDAVEFGVVHGGEPLESDLLVLAHLSSQQERHFCLDSCRRERCSCRLRLARKCSCFVDDVPPRHCLWIRHGLC